MGLSNDLIEAVDGAKPSEARIADRYEIRDRIGRGAFGEVFEVYDHRLGRLVALKTLPIQALASEESAEDLRRFHMEARAVARLSHPGIVTVHDFGETKDFAWIAMELVIGETLKAVLDRNERPSLGETVRVTCALLDALHYAHGRGIVHRDVKPANILLALGAEDGLGEVRLADFGIARLGETQQTVVGQVVGTPTAMAPEQVRGEDVDLRADLWSVGVILYQLLTGKRPFAGGMPGIFNSILTAHPPAPSSIMADLPPALDAVVAKALAKNRNDRYPDAPAMAAALRAAAAAPPVLSPVVLPFASEAEGEDEATIRMVPAPHAEQPPAAPPRRAGSWAVAMAFAVGALCGAVVTYLLLTREVGEGAPSAPIVSLQPPPAEPPIAASVIPAAPEEEPAPEQPLVLPMIAAAPEVPDPVPAPFDRATRPEALPPAEALSEPPRPDPVPPVLPVAEAVPAQPDPPLDLGPVVVPEAPPPAPEVAAPPEPILVAPPPPEQAPLPAAAAPGDGVLARCEADRVAVRSGTHPDFGRVVFQWSTPTRPVLARTSEGAVLRFPGAGCLPSVEAIAMPRNLRAIRGEEEGLRIVTAPGARLRLSRLDRNRVLIDVFDAEP
ncbi:serine/threonine-protein kinase [Roseococcus sp.]|uniref:serine/threonine-protein kinase n=1 Tax=Roseococcus sp. TaxID=2109646 RepID=UPI003BAC46AC